MPLFAPPGEWYPLDPDNRVTIPANRDKDGVFLNYKPHCCRCHKQMKESINLNGISFILVDVDWDNMQVRNNPLGKELIGSDCWSIITKKTNNSQKL